MDIYTIGFTKKSAEQFFGLLTKNQVTVLVDTRLSPDSQLSGFARKQDLPYFLRHLAHCDYIHRLDMAPTKELLSQYRQQNDWAWYEEYFNKLLNERQLITHLEIAWWKNQRACLLCSEHEPDFCHRRLVAEYLAAHWEYVTIHHLM